MGTIRRLKTVLVIDKKVQKLLKVREMASQEIETVSAALNVNLQVGKWKGKILTDLCWLRTFQLIDFDRLDFGESSTLDKLEAVNQCLIKSKLFCQLLQCGHSTHRLLDYASATGMLFSFLQIYLPPTFIVRVFAITSGLFVSIFANQLEKYMFFRVRESMGQTYNIIIMYSPDVPDDQKTEMQIEALKVLLISPKFDLKIPSNRKR